MFGVKGRGVLGRLVQSHKNSRFQLLPIVGTKTHQSQEGGKKKKRGGKTRHNMLADERGGLIKIPFVMLSVDHFIYKSILCTAIKGCDFKRILQSTEIFLPSTAAAPQRQEGPSLKFN